MGDKSLASASVLEQIEIPVTPLPEDEEARLQVLKSYQILDTDEEQAYDDLTHLAATLCEAPTALVTLIDRDRQWVKSRVNWERKQNPRDASFCAHTILHPGQLLEVPNMLWDGRFVQNPLVVGDPAVRFYAGVPLVTREGAAIGAICAIDYKPRRIDSKQEIALKCLARQAAALLELRSSVAELEAQSLTDPLTGAWNRRAFLRLLREEWSKRLRSGKPLSLLMIDIDHFKAINDQFGHQEGDSILKRVSEILSDYVRPNDHLVRYGGEEFSCLLADCDVAAAQLIAERANQAIRSAPWSKKQLTVSIGVAEALPDTDDTPNLLVSRADSALYLAKKLGRDCVQTWKG